MCSEEIIWKFPQVSLLNDRHSNIFPILNSDAWKKNTSQLSFVLGFDVLGNPIICDLGGMQNLLITGKEETGKSSLVSTILTTLLLNNSPASLKLVILDSSRTVLTRFNKIPHLLSPVITDAEKGISALRWTLAEIDRRYKLLSQSGAKNIEGYNEMSGFQALPYIGLFIDDLTEMYQFSPIEYEDSLVRIFQFGKRAGIYTVSSALKATKAIIIGIQSRISFSSDETPILAPNDFLLTQNRDSFPLCIQSPVLSDVGINNVLTFIKDQGVVYEPTAEVTSTPKLKVPGLSGEIDDLFEDAIRIVCQYDRASAALIQRRLSTGYARAARIIDQLEAAKVISASDGSSKPREVLVQDAELFIGQYKNGK